MAEQNMTYEEMLAAFEKLQRETQEKDEASFGPPGTLAPIDREALKRWIADMGGRCEAEARVVLTDILAQKLKGCVGRVIELDPRRVPSWFEWAINGPLCLPPELAGPNPSPFWTIPFMAEYREKDGKKFVHLTVNTGNPLIIVAEYHLYIREL